LSAPADNRSGTGSSTATPTVLTMPCEFNTCPTGSPPEGANATDRKLGWCQGISCCPELILLPSSFPELRQRVPVCLSLRLFSDICYKSHSVDAVRFGIQTLAPRLLGSKPDFVVSGSNVGSKAHYKLTSHHQLRRDVIPR
jgi:5'-nucleotidase